MGCPSIVLQKASDLVISPAYNLAWANLARPEDFDLPTGQNYEWYAMRLNEQREKLQQAQDDSKQQQEQESKQQQGSKKKQGQGNSQGRQQGQYGGQSGQQGGNEQESEQQGQGGNGEQQQVQGRGQGEQPNEMDAHRDGDAPSKGNSGGQQGEESTEDNRQKTTDKSQQSTDKGQGNEGDELTKEKSQQSTVDGNEGDESHAKPTSGYTDLWEEDQFQARQITDIVKSSSSWGSLPGDMIELIKKAAEGKIDYRAVLRMFRASIISQKRRLTRMRPSRRFGFEQMGSRYDFTTHLLIAIDTSGSVGSEDLGRYLNVITSFFKYGIQEIDVLMFDTRVCGKPLTLTDAKKSIKELNVKGRGGTNLQAPVDYAVEHPEYDGLIIITDGYAPCPNTERLRTKLLWVIDNESSYKNIHENLRKTGRVCLMER
jgi:predicted metal-dependent peptidase